MHGLWRGQIDNPRAPSSSEFEFGFEFGECGFARALVKHMCILAHERLCGVIWRTGPGADGVEAPHGHWVCASYIYGAGDWSKHRWDFKDSVGSRSRDMPLSELLGVLDGAEKGKRADLTPPKRAFCNMYNNF